ncbi:FAD/NAD(P)-binding domain-containing protein [Marasmius fiardii PR-910]|nr:FAD/NAD(P)-binding domain-containing protein [Marasmius fiardii PR-910]
MNPTQKRVLVVGAGAAGMSCADTLAQHPDKFSVTLVDAQDYCGGQMFSIPLDKEKHGAEWLNQGVQGGSHIYHHTFHMFEKLGHYSHPVNLQVSFGKEETFWTNVFPTSLVQRHAKEIKRFAWAVKVMRWLEIVFAIIPIKVSLKMFFFSDEFINCMIYPSLALFLGTGNATPNLPTVMMERLYTSPTYGMWYPVDPEMLTSNLPPMVVFPEASRVYSDWKASLEKKGVQVRLSTEVAQVISRSSKGVKVNVRQGHIENTEQYDEIVLCVLSDTAKKILDKEARWIEKRVLGAAKWSDDVTVTHCDIDYMKRWYEVEFNEEQAVSNLAGRDESRRVEEATKNFEPMYYIKQTPADSRKLEMSFDCSAFQYQLSKAITDAPIKKHIFQTIFLNKEHEETWSKHEIAQDTIIKENWWHQLCHSYSHYLLVVPLLFLLNGKRRTTYAGSWTLVNAHELAVISGIAAAYSLGADYPPQLREDQFARLCFRLYLLLVHWKWFDGK